jgi:CheY-like chemotaxis protein
MYFHSALDRSVNSPRILVVDDDPDFQRYITVVLRKRYDVTLATSGDDVRREIAAGLEVSVQS